MILKTLDIENFRGIEKLTIELDRTTVLIGENNTGKTSILEALHTCMSRGLSRRATPFSEYDFHLASENAEPEGAPPLVVTLTFEEMMKDEWAAEIAQAFPNAIQTLDDDHQRLSFRVTAGYAKTTRDFAVEWCFLDKSGNPLPAMRNKRRSKSRSSSLTSLSSTATSPSRSSRSASPRPASSCRSPKRIL